MKPAYHTLHVKPGSCCSACQLMCDAQHLSCFLQYCGHPLPKGKRQLDCAGVVTTVLAICHTLARRPEHADLQGCRFQVGTNSS